MRPDLYEQVQSSTQELVALLSRAPGARVVLKCREILECDAPTATERFGLSSPYRQAFYLLAMAAVSPEPDESTAADDSSFEATWARALVVVRELFDAYWMMYWPASREEWAGRDAASHEHHGIAMRAFLHQHMTGPMADMAQWLARVRAVLAPFDDFLAERVGLSATVAADMCEWIVAGIQRQLDGFTRLADLYQRGIREGNPVDAMIASARADTVLTELLAGEAVGTVPFGVSRARLAAAFGEGPAAAFWRLFATERGAVTLPLGVDQTNPAELAPLFAVDEGEALLPVANPLPPAIWLRLCATFESPRDRERLSRRRGEVHEQHVARLFGGFLGDATPRWVGAYERPGAQLEHDFIALVGRNLIVLEAKAAPPDSVFRDPERAVTRLARHFRADEGIGGGLEQAERVRRHLMVERQPLTLYDRKGAELCTIRPEDVDDVLCVCTTADDFGVLATDLSLFLPRGAGEPFPWAINVHDLETFIDALTRRGWGAERLVQYMLERRSLHGRVFTTDELEIAGVFVRHGSLRQLSGARAEHIQLGGDTASVFDEIFLEKHGGPPARLDPVGPLLWTDLREAWGAALRSTATGPRVAPRPVSGRGGRVAAAATPAPAPKRPTNPDRSPAPKPGRNNPCPCGSGQKYKRCHGR
ncbi:MAG TPA: SEC-C domain-containing protein [Gemmatimonadaceae bacterium]